MVHGLQTLHPILTFNCLRFDVFFGIFEGTIDFLIYFFFKGPSDLRKYALTAVRGLIIWINYILMLFSQSLANVLEKTYSESVARRSLRLSVCISL